jgi:hypothetical protein
MDHHLHRYAESILTGTAEVEGGCTRGVIAGESGKEPVFPVVEVLDKVRRIFPSVYETLRQRRH